MSHTPGPTSAYVCTEGCAETFTDHEQWLAHEALHLKDQRADLLAALKALVYSDDKNLERCSHDGWDEARAAIAKAKGEA